MIPLSQLSPSTASRCSLKPRCLLPFTQEVALHEGLNTIDVVAADLLEHATRLRLRVYADRQGPLVSLEKVELVGQPPQRVRPAYRVPGPEPGPAFY